MEKALDFSELYALQERDEEKDVFDIFCIAVHAPFNWGEMLDIVNKKAMLHTENLIERIRQFPLEWLERIKAIQQFSITPDMIHTLCRDILEHGNNSLASTQQ